MQQEIKRIIKELEFQGITYPRMFTSDVIKLFNHLLTFSEDKENQTLQPEKQIEIPYHEANDSSTKENS